MTLKRSPIGGNPNCTFHAWLTEIPKPWPGLTRYLRCDHCGAVIIDRVAADGPIVDEDDWPKNWILEYIKPW